MTDWLKPAPLRLQGATAEDFVPFAAPVLERWTGHLEAWQPAPVLPRPAAETPRRKPRQAP
ncbi:hypothetical protein [Paracraurococcus lichenis]|uniref:Uncharacterized protein n=1 Tax=Paracraurococcus lichenis TaxID=3064888 RepID=A0ABT9EC90_9PROT|nr:hypothetical protein [Paracraurococcus sp. LOR1-02]MDO9713823.1 hypothetical protein [Paracraurococcus sp. LOR1-02]